MLQIGEKFPDFELTAAVSTEKDEAKAFKTITGDSYSGKWKLYFFWPKDFTFVCPTEIAAFGKLNTEFADRDCQILGASTDNEYVHAAWRTHHADLKDLPFPMLSDIKRDLSGQLGTFFGAPEGEGVLVRSVNSGSPAEKAGMKSGDVITSVNGQPIRVHDIGYAEDGAKELRSTARLNGQPSVSLEVQRQSKANTV